MHKYIFYFLVFFVACTSGKDKYVKAYLYQKPEYQAIQMVPDSSLQLFYNGFKETELNKTSANYTIVNFISTDCGSCYETMTRWGNFLKENTLDNTEVIFIADGVESDYFSNFFKENSGLKFKVYLDREGNYLHANELSAYKKETFLVDREGKVLMYGDPTSDKVINEYYNSVLND